MFQLNEFLATLAENGRKDRSSGSVNYKVNYFERRSVVWLGDERSACEE